MCATVGSKLTKSHYNFKQRSKYQKSSRHGKIRSGENKGFQKSSCYYSKKKSLHKKDCFKLKAVMSKKSKPEGKQSGKSFALVCFEANLINVHLNSWWIDTRPSHLSLFLRKSNQRSFKFIVDWYWVFFSCY